MKRNKLITLLCLLMVLSLAACGAGEKDSSSSKKNNKPKTETSVNKPSSSNTVTSNSTVTESVEEKEPEINPEEYFPFWRDDVVSVTTKISKNYGTKDSIYYNKYGHIVATTTSSNHSKNFVCNYDYDENGQLLCASYEVIHSDDGVVETGTVEYDPSVSACEKATDECCYVWHIRFSDYLDYYDCVPTERIKKIQKSIKGNVYTYVFEYDEYGHGYKMQLDENGDIYYDGRDRIITYDEFGRMNRSNFAPDNPDYYYEYVYEDNIVYWYTVSDGERGTVSTYKYDNGKIVEIATIYEEGAEPVISCTYEYDSQGRLLKYVNVDYDEVTEYQYDSNGNVIQEELYRLDTSDRSQYHDIYTYEYDDMNRMIKSESFDVLKSRKYYEYTYEYYEVK